MQIWWQPKLRCRTAYIILCESISRIGLPWVKYKGWKKTWICKKHKSVLFMTRAPIRTAFHISDHYTIWAISSGLSRLSFWSSYFSDTYFFLPFFILHSLLCQLLLLNNKSHLKADPVKYCFASHDYGLCSDDSNVCISSPSHLSQLEFIIIIISLLISCHNHS